MEKLKSEIMNYPSPDFLIKSQKFDAIDGTAQIVARIFAKTFSAGNNCRSDGYSCGIFS